MKRPMAIDSGQARIAFVTTRNARAFKSRVQYCTAPIATRLFNS